MAGAKVVPIPYDLPTDQLKTLHSFVPLVSAGAARLPMHVAGSLTAVNDMPQVLERCAVHGRRIIAGVRYAVLPDRSDAIRPDACGQRRWRLHAAVGNVVRLGTPPARTLPCCPLHRDCLCSSRVGFVQSRSMGFQLLNILTSHNQSVLSTDAFDSYGVPLPLDLADGATSSRFISAAPSDVLEWLTSDNITVNLHHDGVKPETFKSNAKLSSFYQMISTNKGLKGNVRALCAGCEACMRRLTLAVVVPAGIREHH